MINLPPFSNRYFCPLINVVPFWGDIFSNNDKRLVDIDISVHKVTDEDVSINTGQPPAIEDYHEASRDHLQIIIINQIIVWRKQTSLDQHIKCKRSFDLYTKYTFI